MGDRCWGLDVLADIPAADGRRIPYEELARTATTIQGEGFVIRAAALDDIIASKELGEPEEGPRGSP